MMNGQFVLIEAGLFLLLFNLVANAEDSGK